MRNLINIAHKLDKIVFVGGIIYNEQIYENCKKVIRRKFKD